MIDSINSAKNSKKLDANEQLAATELLVEPEMRQLVGEALVILGKEGFKAAAAGVAGAGGALGLAGLLGTASTGTAIAGLSGAAATNATLAFLGGGALSAGGWGMAGGMLALGSLATAPILLAAGQGLNLVAERKKTAALTFALEVDRSVAELDQRCCAYEVIGMRVEEVRREIARLRGKVDELVRWVEVVVDVKRANTGSPKVNYDDLPEPTQNEYRQLIVSAKALSQMLKMNVTGDHDDGRGTSNGK